MSFTEEQVQQMLTQLTAEGKLEHFKKALGVKPDSDRDDDKHKVF